MLIAKSTMITYVHLRRSNTDTVQLFKMTNPNPNTVIITTLLRLQTRLLAIKRQSNKLTQGVSPYNQTRSRIPDNARSILFKLHHFRTSITFPRLMTRPMGSHIAKSKRNAYRQRQPMNPHLMIHRNLSPRHRRHQTIVHPIRIRAHFANNGHYRDLRNKDEQNSQLYQTRSR